MTLTEPSVKKKTFILIDFDNFYPHESLDEESVWLKIELNNILNVALDINDEITFLNIRFYGGWMTGGIHTNKASKIQQAIGELDFFPIYNKNKKEIIHGGIELVTQLISVPNIKWEDTVRIRSGIPRIRLNSSGLPVGCKGSNKDCPVRILYRFAKKRNSVCPVEGCEVTKMDAFKFVEQKMVDTMLSCDLITLSNDINVDTIIIFTNDFDLLPPIALALNNKSTSDKKIFLKRTNENCNFQIFQILKDMGLNIIF